jgi:16S rRNA (adenine1518-N6/adenine1519-N6)-dimethyltransferase
LVIDPARLVAAAQIDETRRPETVSVGGFVAMARELTHIRSNS